MLIRRLSPWRSPDGARHGVGDVVDMDDDLAAIHVAHGSAEAVEVPAPPAPAEPAPPLPPAAEAAHAPAYVEPPKAPHDASRKRRH